MTNNKKNKAIILLSGGLDSVVSLAESINKGLQFELAITFNYGQKAFQKEFDSSKKIVDYYKIKHKCIELDWLQKITNTSLVSEQEIPDVNESDLDDKTITNNSMKNVWVPNRNGLFINIAAAYADSYNYDYIVIGANKEEASTFSDNSKQFIDAMNEVLKTSTNYDIKVLAPLIDLDKNEIVKKALELKVPLENINSCYSSNKGKHCGLCESCNRLKRALQNNSCDNILKEFFEN